MKIGKFFFAVMALAIFFASPNLFADPTVTASVSAHEVPVNGQLTLAVEIQGLQNVDAISAINIPNVTVENAGQTRSIQLINGSMSSMVTFNFVLSPSQPGSFTIPAITVTSGGKTYTTQPIAIQAVNTSSAQGPQGARSAAPSQGNSGEAVDVPSEGLKPAFITASVDKTKGYVGQQLLLRVQFLRRPNLPIAAQPRYSEPDMTGFLVETLQQQEYTTAINGASYNVTELRYALFPTSDGDFAIGSARVELAVRVEADPFDPNSFFQNFFGRAQQVKLTTRAIPVHVRSLPKTKPPNYSGAVGRFKLSAKVDSSDLEVGKPFNLIVTVEGVGNIKTLKEPTWPEMKSFKRYETLSSVKISNEGKFIHGSKEFKVLLIPQVSGSLTIPALEYVYFDPDKNDFVTATTDDIYLTAKPGTLNAGDQPGMVPAFDSNQPLEGVQVIEKDIRFQKRGKISFASPPIYRQGLFYLLNAAPLVFAVGAFFASFQARQRLKNADYYRVRKAARRALSRLKKIERSLKNMESAKFSALLYNALADFIADKLKISASGIVWDDVSNRLLSQNIPIEVIKSVRHIAEEADMVRFGTFGFSELEKIEGLNKTREAILALDGLMKE